MIKDTDQEQSNEETHRTKPGRGPNADFCALPIESKGITLLFSNLGEVFIGISLCRHD
jgi:hypothetical protein